MRNPAALKAPPFAIRFANLDRDAPCVSGETIFQAARRSGIRVVGACGGRGVCGTCKVRIVSGEVESLKAESAPALASDAEWVRACQLRPLADCVVEVAPRSLGPVVRAEVDGQGATSLALDPAIHLRALVLPPPTLEHPAADGDRVLEMLRAGGAETIDFAALRELPVRLRDNGWRVRAIQRGNEVIGFIPRGTRCLGLAIDLGTTNCAGFLLDLESGRRLDSLGIENPQAAYGADLVSRVNYALRSPERGQELRAAAVTAVSELARDLCEAVSAAPEDIADVAICGNTAMHHLLLGLPVDQLGRAPFVPATCEPLDVKARDLGIAAAPGAWAHLLPNVGGFVGGDHVAALLATEERWKDATAIVMDIGTNTEVSLVHGGSIVTVSSPSGPALEGGHISSGMRAAEGAIERVRIEDGQILLDVIGEEKPIGLCGSGVLDAMAVMVESGLVNRRGRIRDGRPHVRIDGDHREVLLAPDVAFTQNDVRAVQLAKAAIRSGIDLLLREAGLDEAAIERVIIAGAFGAYIRVESAIAIGLLPRLPLDRFEQVGNAAGVGVRMALASVAMRERSRSLAKRCRYLELGSLPGFQKTFLGRIGFD